MLGIDLGTQNTRVAYSGDEQPVLVRDKIGSSEIPSVVFCAPGSAGPIAGRSAVAPSLEYPQFAARSFKRLLGLLPTDPLTRKLSSMSVTSSNEALAPEAVTSVMLAHCASRAAATLGASSPYAALVAPPWFDPAQKNALRGAASAAGLHLVDLISSPAATALSIAREQERRVAIVDIGAGGISAAVVNVAKTHLEVIAASSDRMIGGDDLDEAILERALREVSALAGTVQDAKKLVRLRASCELAKKEFCSGNRRPTREGTRPRFDAMLDAFVRSVEHVCNSVFQSVRVQRDPVHAVYFTGQMGRIDRLRDAVRCIFDKTVSEDLPPESAAIGASMFVKARMTGRELRIGEGPLASMMFPAIVSASEIISGPLLAASSAPSFSFEAAREPRSINEVLKGGALFVPATAAEIIALPLGRPLTENDIAPIALPVLLARVLARKQVTGTVSLASAKEKIDIAVHQGVAVLEPEKLGALGSAFRWPGGTYTFDFSIPRRDPDMHGFFALTIRGLRNTLRAEPEPRLKAALADRLALAPRLKPERASNLPRFAATVQESAFLKLACSGVSSAEDALKRNFVARDTALGLLIVLTAFNFVDWVRPGDLDRATSSIDASRA